jgi:hypothetical protein
MTNAELPEAPIPDTHVGILETALLATVSTISHKDGLISTNPVGFDWDGEYVRLSTLKSRVKYRNLVANPQVTFCAVDPKMPMRYIEIRGSAMRARVGSRLTASPACPAPTTTASKRTRPKPTSGRGPMRVFIGVPLPPGHSDGVAAASARFCRSARSLAFTR